MRFYRDYATFHTREAATFVLTKVLIFNALLQFVWKRVRQGYVELTADQIALKRSLHFSLPATYFSLYRRCYWPLVDIWIFKRRFISLSCLYSQSKGGKSCTVFLFHPPKLRPADELRSSFYISPSCLLSPSSFALCSKCQSTETELKVFPVMLRILSKGSCWLTMNH